MTFKRLLVLAPHTDDAELGCGGTIARFLEEGRYIHVAAFSTAEGSLPHGAPPDLLKREFVESMRILGLGKENYSVYDYPVRQLSEHRQEVLDELLRLKKEVEPDVVLIPSGSDLHQDHQVLWAEGMRAFKDRTTWGYELPWNHITFSANAFVTFGPTHLEMKWKALQAYKSQIDLTRPYFSKEFVESLARIRGVQVKAQFAEAYDVMRIRI